MKFIVGCDHGGINLKSQVANILQNKGHQVVDVGTNTPDSVDYPDFAVKVAMAVSSGEADMGVLVCGTGLGMSMTANKVAGVRAAVCTNEYMAAMARAHNDANVLCLGERVVGPGLTDSIVEAFLSNDFEGDRHERRVGKINALDTKD